MTNSRKFLVVKTRNLGDAVIGTALVQTIARAFPISRIDVLTRPEISGIFLCNPHVTQVFTGRFPMGSVHDFGAKEALKLLKLIGTLRRERYTDVVNVEGDFREEYLGCLITHNENWSPVWPAGHPYCKVVRQPLVRLANRPVPIPRNLVNVHEAVAFVGTAVSGATAQKPALYTSLKEQITWVPQNCAVGFHPMASQPWRCWELGKWVSVAQALIERGIHVHVFGSPAEREQLRNHFGRFNESNLSILTGSVGEYFEAVSRMRVFLCPDSFASHVAYALGVPTILLNGANDAQAWAPPGTMVLAAGPDLKCYPCYNRPTCIGSAHEFACVRRIETESVLDTVWEVLRNVAAPRPSAPAQFQLPVSQIS